MDPMVQAVFQNMVIPTMRKLPLDDLREVRTFLVTQLDAIIAERETEVAQPTAEVTTDAPDSQPGTTSGS